jgi:catechol-2,3-dioxygenase
MGKDEIWVARVCVYRNALRLVLSTGRAATLVQMLASPLDGASDHGVSEVLYLRDPDENGLELYRDRPPNEWPRTADGKINM